MAKLHSALLNAELHNPKGITSNSTASIMELNQAQSAISSSADFVPTTTATYDLGSATLPWKEIFVTTSSINFVNPAGTTVQQIKATPAGVTFTSGSGAVANISGSIISGSALHIQGNAKVTGDLTLGGQITLGDADSDDVVFEAEVSSSIIPDADNTYDLGSSGKQWKDIYVNGVGYIDSLGTDGDPVTAYINAGELDGVTLGAESAVGNITSTGTITGSAIYGTTIGQNRVDGVKTLTIEANSIINQDLSTDADATLGTLGVGNVTSTGTVSGSAVYGTTIGQNRTDGLKTITIEANSTINQDVSTDANATLGTLSVGNVTSTGTVSGSAVYGTTLGQNRTDGLKTITIESNSVVNQDLTTDADVQFAAITGSIISSSGALTAESATLVTDLAVAHGGTGASTLTDGGVLLGSGTSAVTAMSVLADSEMIVGDGSTDPVAESGATLRTSIGVGTTDDVSFGSLISGSADLWVGDTTNYVSASGGTLKVTGAITGSSVRASDIKVGVTAANEIDTQVGNLILDSAGGTVQVTDILDIDGDISLETQATDIDLIDDNASALSFDASGKTGILEIDTQDGAEKVKMSGAVDVTGNITGATISGSSIDGTAIRHNTATGLHSLTLNEDLLISDGAAVTITSVDQTNTLTLNEGFTIGGGNTGTLTYSGASKTLTVEDTATVDQDLTKDADVQFNSLVLDGDLTAQRIIVSSSVSNVTQSFSSGSTIFGDTIDDTHQVTGSLQVSGAAEVKGNLTVETDSTYTLGGAAKAWSTVYADNIDLDGQGRIDLDDDQDTSIRASADDVIRIEIAGADELEIDVDSIRPVTSDGSALGDTDQMWSDLFLASGGVVNFNNGNMTLSHAAGILDVAGGLFRVAGLITGSTDLVVGDISNTKTYISASGGNLKVSHDVFAQDYSGSTAAFGSNVTSEGTISGSSVYGTTIGQNRVDGLKTITIEANSIINQDVSTDADATLGTLGVGNVTSTGTVTGSAVYGTTIGQNTTGGLKTLSIESNSTINQDVTTDATPTFNGVTSTGTVSGSAVYGTLLGQNRVDGLKTITIEANSIINQDLSTDAGATFSTLAVGNVTSTGTVSGSAVYGTTIGQNRVDGLKTITIEANSTINQDVTTDATPTFNGVTSTGTVTGSAVYGTLLGQNRTDGVKTITVEANSAINQDVTSDAGPRFETIELGAASDTTIARASAGDLNIEGNVIYRAGGTDVPVADGGTGASSLTDGYVLLGSGTGAITALDVTADGAMLVGDGSGDPVAESGATLRTSVGVGTTDDVSFGSLISGSADLFVGAKGTNFISGSGGNFKVSGRLFVGDGSSAIPSINFTSDGNSGFFLESADDIGVSLAGAEEFRFANGGTFHADADVVAYSSTVASDMNLKENITDMKYGLDTVMQLRGVEYDWKREDMGHDVGVLAQEVESVIPELVKEHEGLNGKGSFKSVDYNKLVPILIESIKELKTEVDSLKVLTEVNELKS